MIQILNARSKTLRKRLDILRSAAGAFRRRGFDGTGMREIARGLGVQPGALYYYFRNKREILYFCQDYSLDRLLEAAGRISRSRVGPDGKLRELIVEQMRCMLDELQGSAAHIEFHALPEGLLRRIVEKRDRYERVLRRVLLQGMRSGVFRRASAKLIALAILGAINWSIKWYRPDGPQGADEIASVFADYLVRGLRR